MPAGAAASTPAADAMERARRAADSPLRAILEAAKVRRRAEPDAPAETDGAPRRAGAQRALSPDAGRAEGVPRAVAAAGAAAVPDNGAGSDGHGASATGAADSPSGLAEPGSPIITIRTLPSEAAAAPARSAALDPAAIDPLHSDASPAQRAELPRPLPPTGELALRPELLHMVEPAVTPRLLDQLTRPEVTVEFTIQKDGSVSGVQVLPPVPRQLVQFVIEAVEQWRFAPLPAARQHRAQLVFKRER